MSEFAALTRLFDLPASTVEQWLELQDLPVRWGAEQIERVCLIRFLLDYLKDTQALALVRRVYKGRTKPIPVFSVVNRKFLDLGDQVYDLYDGAEVQLGTETEVLISTAVNLDGFGKLLCDLRDELDDHQRCSADLAADVIPTSSPQSSV